MRITPSCTQFGSAPLNATAQRLLPRFRVSAFGSPDLRVESACSIRRQQLAAIRLTPTELTVRFAATAAVPTRRMNWRYRP
jgi:hypothetical protein